MFDIFEQPWTLLITAILILLVMLMFRRILPEKKHWGQWLLPAFLSVAAFGFDLLVKTDTEKINALINTGIKAVEEENSDAIAVIIANDYSDTRHRTKEQLLAHAKRQLSQSPVEKVKRTGLLIEISPPTATAVLTVMMRFVEDSHIAQTYKKFVFVKVRLRFKKQPDKSWLINRIEILEIDRQPVNWRDIR